MLIKSDHCWMPIKQPLIQQWSALISIGLHWSSLSKIDLYWSGLIVNDLYWSTLGSIPKIWSLLIGIGDWSSMSWYDLVHFLLPWPDLIVTLSTLLLSEILELTGCNDCLTHMDELTFLFLAQRKNIMDLWDSHKNTWKCPVHSILGNECRDNPCHPIIRDGILVYRYIGLSAFPNISVISIGKARTENIGKNQGQQNIGYRLWPNIGYRLNLTEMTIQEVMDILPERVACWFKNILSWNYCIWINISSSMLWF